MDISKQNTHNAQTQTQTSYILDFWFPSKGFQKFWFSGNKSSGIDKDIYTKFSHVLQMYNDGQLDNLQNDSFDSILALIILLDQLTRNIFRNEKRDPKYDIHALELSKRYIKRMENTRYTPRIEHLVFVLMPFRHTGHYDDTKYVVDFLDTYKDIYENEKLFQQFKNTSMRMLKKND